MRQRKELEKTRRAGLQGEAAAQPATHDEVRPNTNDSVEPPATKARGPLRGEQFHSPLQSNADAYSDDEGEGQSELPFVNDEEQED
jgi:hypothetical protein